VFKSAEPLSAAATLPGSVDSERMFYSTATAKDRDTTATAAVHFPPGPAPAGGWPVVAWAHGTVGVGDSCAYSTAGPAGAERDWAYLGTWLKEGYAVVTADYAGLGTPDDHPYLNGKVAAHNVVDAVKAATEHYSSMSNKWVVIGQSQGGVAAVETARYATEFGGPGLDFRGAVGTGVGAYLEDIVAALGPDFPTKFGAGTITYALYVLQGLDATYPELNIESFLTPAAASGTTGQRRRAWGRSSGRWPRRRSISPACSRARSRRFPTPTLCSSTTWACPKLVTTSRSSWDKD
jgi:hypothetical protein